jgi:hypothetical protein
MMGWSWRYSREKGRLREEAAHGNEVPARREAVFVLAGDEVLLLYRQGEIATVTKLTLRQ